MTIEATPSRGPIDPVYAYTWMDSGPAVTMEHPCGASIGARQALISNGYESGASSWCESIYDAHTCIQ